MTPPRTDVAAVILAGGRGRRLGGVVKPLLAIEGRAIIDRLRDALAPHAHELLLAVADPAQAQGLGDARLVIDAVPGAGPVAGLAAARAATDARWLIAVAGDMPHVTSAVIAALLARAGDDVDAVAIRLGTPPLPEPLLAVWGRAAAPMMARALERGRYRTSALLTDDGLRVAWLEEADLRAVDPQLRSVQNVNRPTDL
ncbi:MAG: NTP transferase domain-containing protein [Deltaproteobacteria bacterium]|nr:NTP transferase domain-containing protein [Deltaproteobacteria bacterium]